MKLKVLKPIINFDGKPLKDGEKIEITQSIIEGLKNLNAKNQLTGFAALDFIQQQFDANKKIQDLTFRTVLHEILSTVYVGDDGKREILSASDKAMAFEITKKIFDFKEPDFTEKQVEFILARVDKVGQSPLICGRIKEALTKK